MAAVEPNERKFRELLLYVAKRCEGDPRFGATKLNKILFFAEFIAYGKLGHPIAGMAYQKLEWGPAPRRLLPVLEAMKRNEECAEQVRDVAGYKQKRLIALREANLDEFSGAEVALVDDVIDQLRDHDAVSVSELSHRFAGWELASLNEDIPYETVFLSRRPLTEPEREYARNLRPTSAPT